MSERLVESRITALHQLIAALHERLAAEQGQAAEVLPELLDDLQTALAELHVAEEEQYQQNEALAAARLAAEAERQRYQELFDFAPDGYLVTDADGTIQEANRAAAILLGEGKTVKEIAEALSLSVKTISTYRMRILRKLHLHTTADLIRYVLSEQLLSQPSPRAVPASKSSRTETDF